MGRVDDAYEAAERSADWLRNAGLAGADVVLVAGSGWQGITEEWGPPDQVVAMREVPGYPVPVAEGHGGTIGAYDVSGRRVLTLTGRTHLYEGRGPSPVVHGVRTAAALGCGTAILTNANGSFRPDWKPGTCVALRDHLNLTATSPLIGARFVDLTVAYSERLRTLARALIPGVVEGTYAMLPGSHYETHAEGRMLKVLGADVVGMSTVLETIAARQAGLEVLALSMVTVTEGETEIDPSEVVAVAADAATKLSAPLARLITEAGR